MFFNVKTNLTFFTKTILYDKVSYEFKKRVPAAKKLITRSIMPETSPNSPHITLTHPKSRFAHFWDQPQPPSWSKLAICAKIGLVFLSGQESNPKVHGYREKFNIGNVAQIFFVVFYTCWEYAISFSEIFSMLKFSPSPSTPPHPCPGHISKNETFEDFNFFSNENRRKKYRDFFLLIVLRLPMLRMIFN